MSGHDHGDESPHDILAGEAFAIGSADPQLDEARPHDVLAAEEFAMPAPDPRLEHARDVLAAEEFAVPAPDPALGHQAITLPPDISGNPDPHDVLAAEEFAMPAPPPGSAVPLRSGWPISRLRLAGGALLVLALLRARRRPGGRS